MYTSNRNLITFSCIIAYFIANVGVSGAKDTLGVNESLGLQNGDFLESANQRFRLLSVNNSSFLVIQYVYMNHSINVWIANNYQTTSGWILNLTMNGNGRLEVYGSYRDVAVLIVNAEQEVMFSNTTATLLDNGNLVLRSRGRTVWQSFDYPSNTWLPGMKIGIFGLNTSSTKQIRLHSMPSRENPSSTLGIAPNNTEELIVVQDGEVYWRSGIWNGRSFAFLEFSVAFGITFSHVSNVQERYFIWNSSDPYASMVFGSLGQVTVFSGDFRVNQTLTGCEPDEINGKEQSEGCVNLCGGRDVFKQSRGTLEVWDEHLYFGHLLDNCKQKCRSNCSCYAYAYITYQNTSFGCRFSGNQKANVFHSDEQTFFFRESLVLEKASPEPAPTPLLAPGPSRSKKPKKWKVALSVGVVATFLAALALLFLCCKLRRRNGCLGGVRNLMNKLGTIVETAGVRNLMNKLGRSVETPNLGGKGDDESLFFSFTSIQIATDHFCDENKLGEGGFGPVYKGKLVNGVEIAVKRLNRMSGHGIEQFKNEVTVISKLQHRNLVRLLGYCIHSEERLLIYEYLQNKSLDSILFDVAKRDILDWKRRLRIIEGVAQGLLYLHKYSRLKIIHRDLKTSNVLLDKDLNPKISDFGTARIFGDNEIRANTNTIVGTYGYMSPEYAMDGIFSEKSDVFSFGVMILEIISGKKNTSFYDSDRHLNLIGHVWDLWTEGRILEIVDSSLDETISKREVLQCVQVGLLCVQENASDRPLMSDVVSMLQNESMVLASPRRPAFSEIMSLNNTRLPENPEYCTVNKVTISDLDGR